MKTIEIDDELYQYIAGNTRHIGESASSILRRLLKLDASLESRVPEHRVPKAAKTQVPKAVQLRAVEPQATAPAPLAPPAKNIEQVLLGVAKNPQKAVVRRFLSLLTALHQLQPEAFSQVLEIRGRNRLYFALSEDELLQSGRSTNPVEIPQTPYWVIGNTNTERKREILAQVMQKLGYTPEQIGKAVELLA